MISITVDDSTLRANMRKLRDRDVRTASSWALNDTASDVLAHVQARMDEVFDRPTRFTKNAFTIRGARPSRLEAQVTERPSVGSRHYLKVQEFGGRRGRTGLEGLLDARLSWAGVITAVAPAGGARLDAHGNWSTAERNQALSAVQSQRDVRTNTTTASRKRNRRRAGFFVPREGSRLSPGIWKRNPDGSIQKVLHFTSAAPVYQRRLGFFDGAEEVWRRNLPLHLRRTIDRMVARLDTRP